MDLKRWEKIYKENKKGFIWDIQPVDFIKEKISFLKSQEIKTILDAGCGDGKNLLYLVKEGFEVTGIDISKTALKKCKNLLKGYSNFKLQKQDLRKLKRGYFDALICDHTLVHIKDIKKVLDNFYKILKDKGYMILEFTSTKDPLFKKKGNLEVVLEGIYFRFFTPSIIKSLLNKFIILEVIPKEFIHPSHEEGYMKRKKHKHHSYFVLAQKVPK